MTSRRFSERTLVISGLNESITYTIEVAAVNSAGIGEYSNPITSKTDGKKD